MTAIEEASSFTLYSVVGRGILDAPFRLHILRRVKDAAPYKNCPVLRI